MNPINSTSRKRDVIIHGVALGLFGMLADLADGELPQMAQDSQRIFQLKWIVRDQLYSPELNVRFIAKRMNCSADYISHLFHKETGETLIQYIHRQRMIGAKESLAHSSLSVSEIAWACGFADAGYFARVFRSITKTTPMAYRRKVQQELQSVEVQPKTIYHKSDDFSPGTPGGKRTPDGQSGIG